MTVIETFITSTALIAVLIVLRFALRGRIDARLQYALWMLAAVRLLMFVPAMPSSLSVANIGGERELERTLFMYDSAPIEDMASVGVYIDDSGKYQMAASIGYAQLSDDGRTVEVYGLPTTGDLLIVVWLVGAAAVFGLLLLVNIRFGRRLRRLRKRSGHDVKGYTVWCCEGLRSPCVFGVFRPAIYVTPELAADEHALRNVLTHEYSHIRHKDHIWGYVRGLCVALHWFNPLVWVAAWLSRRDCEMACDRSAILLLGEDKRFDYSRTLVDLSSIKTKPSDMLCGATTMSGGKSAMKERITMITRSPKTAFAAVAVAALIVCLAVACTFTGGAKEANAPLAGTVSTSDEAAGFPFEVNTTDENELPPEGSFTVTEIVYDRQLYDTEADYLSDPNAPQLTAYTSSPKYAWTAFKRLGILTDAALIEQTMAELGDSAGWTAVESGPDVYGRGDVIELVGTITFGRTDTRYTCNVYYIYSDREVINVDAMVQGEVGFADAARKYIGEDGVWPARVLIGGTRYSLTEAQYERLNSFIFSLPENVEAYMERQYAQMYPARALCDADMYPLLHGRVSVSCDDPTYRCDAVIDYADKRYFYIWYMLHQATNKWMQTENRPQNGAAAFVVSSADGSTQDTITIYVESGLACFLHNGEEHWYKASVTGYLTIYAEALADGLNEVVQTGPLG